MKVERLGMAAHVSDVDAPKDLAQTPQAAAIRPVSTTLEARADFGQPSGEDLARRRGQRLDALDRVASRTLDVLETIKALPPGTLESEARMAGAAAEVVAALAGEANLDAHYISPPLPSPLASMRAALRAYSATQSDAAALAERTPLTHKAIMHAADVLVGQDGVIKTLGSLGEGGAPTGGISSIVDNLSGRLNNLRDQLRVAREAEVDRVAADMKRPPAPYDVKA